MPGTRAFRGGARIVESLSEGLPLKILVETDDILDESTFAEGSFSLGTQLARSAMGLGDVFVLQSTSSNLYRVRERVLAALEFPGPALLSVFTGAGDGTSGLPPYLVSAAAMESRAFPAFSYDPAAGGRLGAAVHARGEPAACGDLAGPRVLPRRR